MPSIEEEVRVHRDTMAIPHIFAENESDAWFSLGYVHAQDRLFQADISRRVAYGGLSEWLGDETIELDAFMLGLGLRGRAYETIQGLDPEVRASLEAYAQGMNAGAASLNAMPIEYRLLNTEFEPWSPVDSLGIVYLLSWGLSGNLSTELFALSMRKKLDHQQMEALLRINPDTPGLDLYWNQLEGVELGPWTPQFTAFNTTLGNPDAMASNNWAIGASRSTDGSPIIANDPHLPQAVPSLWYAAEVQGGELHAMGMTFPGTPGIVIGHNEHVAWGLTNVMSDTVDLAVLERHGELGYLHQGASKAFVHKKVRVQTKDGVVERTMLYTEVGPALTTRAGTHVVAMRWSTLEMKDESVAALHNLMKATSVQEAGEQVQRPSIVSQNYMLGDDQGHIGWAVTGAWVRRKGFTGRIPYLASDPKYAWQGWLGPRPFTYDPPEDFIVTANHRPDHPAVDAVSSNYAPAWRKERIESQIKALPQRTWATEAALQFDLYDGQGAHLAPNLLAGVTPSNDNSRQCAAILTAWDHQATADSAGAAVWAVFQRELILGLLSDEIGEEAARRYMLSTPVGLTVLDGKPETFTDDLPAEVDAALDRTCIWLGSELGDAGDWKWGALHPLALTHVFGDKLPKWNMPVIEYPGTGNTVNAGGYLLGDNMAAGSIASLRMVMPLGDLGASTFSHPGGQSGHPTHPDTDTLWSAYLSGKQVPMWFGEAAVLEHRSNTLTFTPAR